MLQINDLHRLEAVMANSQHLRGTRSVTDLAFSRIEDLNYIVSELYRLEAEHQATLCYRIHAWFRRAIA